MTPKDSKALYEKACGTRRVKPQQEEYEQWHKNLRDFEPRDAQSALDAWWASTERDKDGELKSKWLPVPGELMALVIRARDKRIARSREPEDMVLWRCDVGHTGSRTLKRSQGLPAYCQCGAKIATTQATSATIEARLPDSPESDKALLARIQRGAA